MTLYPVLVPVSCAAAGPAERSARQRVGARRALRHCARLVGAPPVGWFQRNGGAPLPNGDFHWSISHTRGLAAAVIAREPIGVDVERIRPRRHDVFDEVGGEEEWSLFGGRTVNALFRLWTAKEAVVKANGLGIGHLRQCLTRGDRAAGRIEIEFFGTSWKVYHHAPAAEYIAAIALRSPCVPRWQFVTRDD